MDEVEEEEGQHFWRESRQTVGNRLQVWSAGGRDDDDGNGQSGAQKNPRAIERGESFSWPGLLDGVEGERKRRQHNGFLREGAESKQNRSRRVSAAMSMRDSTSVQVIAANPKQRCVTSPNQ